MSSLTRLWNFNIRLFSIPLAIVTLLVLFLSRILARPEDFYIFTPESLRGVQLRAIDQNGNNTFAIVQSIVSELRANGDVAPYVSSQEEWFFNNAGGAMGALYIIHASLTEYLIIFGTAIGTEGHTGRHTADDYFHILSGVQYAYSPPPPGQPATSQADFEPEIYPAGSVHHLRRGEVKQYSMREACFALEYARGWIPGMLLFGYADGLSSTTDWRTLWATTRVTGGQMLGNLMSGKV